MEDIFEKKVEGDFNSGLSIIYRLDSIRKAIINTKLVRTYDAVWTRFELDMTWQEHLLALIKGKKRLSDEDNVTIEKYRAYLEWMRSNMQIIDKNRRLNTCTPKHVFEDFDMWEQELAILEHRLGMGMPIRADARYTMSDRKGR